MPQHDQVNDIQFPNLCRDAYSTIYCILSTVPALLHDPSTPKEKTLELK